ncbi:MAG: hypothetical protein ACLFR1_05945 [Spirochaetia bacterium]
MKGSPKDFPCKYNTIGDTLEVFIDINGTTFAYAIDYVSYYVLNNNMISVDEFVNRIQQMPIK